MFDFSGAKNVISAYRECRVRRLIYNSSADVVVGGLHDIRDGDESLAYPWKVRFLLNELSFLFCYLLMARLDDFVLRMNKHF